ncbi:FAD-dependent monooxygenase [Streptomyces odontomachi]|uniref:FAD-dependent monooxygenase n=1 Tax=Streptomyces odontomachi TaxID=2944940 RepID=UPI002109225A|nr:FAD-dependent monooxygenase [Streptomyces sp. ODS25]
METEVAIVGAGPTGLALAHELALAGVDVLVLEKLQERVVQTKGGGIQPRTAELLQLRGLLEPLLTRAMPRDPVGGHFAMLPVPLDCTPWHTRQPYPIGIPQWEIEEVLEERAVARGARVLRGAEVTDMSAVGRAAPCTEPGTVTVTAGDTQVKARYLVACDGGHSTIRRFLGMPFPGRAGTYQAVLTDVRLTAVSSLVPQRSGHISTLTRRAGRHWGMLVPIGGERYRFTFGRVDPADPDRATGQEADPERERGTGRGADRGSGREAAGSTRKKAGRTTVRGTVRPTGREAPVTGDEITAALHDLYGTETELGGVYNASRFSDATRQLEQYRVGRVLFAGDAAHIHPPLGGQGLNLGIQDAFNLGWKLAATLRGHAPKGLLDSYETERHPAAASVLHHTSAQRVLANPDAPADVVALRDIVTDLMRLPDTNRHLAGLMSGLSLRYELPGAHPLIGQRVPDVDLVTPDGPTRLSGLFGTGHAVLLDLAGVVPADLKSPQGVDLVRAGCPDGGLDAGAVLLRPDGYVCWAADDPASCRDTLLAAIRDHLTTA